MRSAFDITHGREGRRWTRFACAAGLLIALSSGPALADEAQDRKELTEADKDSAIWHIAEAEIIAERCPYATIDQQARVDFILRSHVDLEPASEDGKLYAYRLQERRDHFWARNEHEMCLHGVIGYGPRGIGVRNLMILKAPYGEK